MEIQKANPAHTERTHSPSLSQSCSDPLGHVSVNSIASSKANSSAKENPGVFAKVWDCVMYIPRMIGSAVSWAYNNFIHVITCCPDKAKPDSLPAKPVTPRVLSLIEHTPAEFIKELGTDPNASVMELISSFDPSPQQFTLFFQNKGDQLLKISQAIPPQQKAQIAALLKNFNETASVDICKGLIPCLRMFVAHCAEKAGNATPLAGKEQNVANVRKYFETTLPDLLTEWENDTSELATFWVGDGQTDGIEGIRNVLLENKSLSEAFEIFVFDQQNVTLDIGNFFYCPDNLFPKQTLNLQYETLHTKLLGNLIQNAGPSICETMLESFDESSPVARHLLTNLSSRLSDPQFCKEFAIHFPEIVRQFGVLAQ